MNKRKIEEVKEVSLRAIIITALLVLTCILDAHARTLQKITFTYNRKIAVDIPALAQLSQEVSQFLSTVHKSSFVQVDEGNIFQGIISLNDVKETVVFLAKTASKNPGWLKTHWFYNTFFDFYRLYSDGSSCPAKIGKLPRGWKGSPEHHRITTYRICKISGSHKKTKEHDFPLYSCPFDEQGKKPGYIREHKKTLTRFAYTRQQIVDGALEPGKAQIIAWVRSDGYNELVMQGSAVIDFEDGSPLQMFQVVVHNEKNVGDKYWFIAPYEKRKPSKKYPVKVDPIPGVSFAGNISELGFGKLLVMIGKNPLTLEEEMRIGMLVDTGHAFQDNLCKFDLFTGYFDNHEQSILHARQYPHTAQIYILIKKKKGIKGF